MSVLFFEEPLFIQATVAELSQKIHTLLLAQYLEQRKAASTIAKVSFSFMCILAADGQSISQLQ